MVEIYSTTYINSVFAIRRGLSSSILTRFFSTRNGIPSCFLFRGMIRNRIPRVSFYFCSTERNSQLFFLPLKSSEGNFESLLLVWYHGTEFIVVFSSAEGFGRQFWEFACIVVQRNGIPNCFLFRGRVRNGIPRGFCSAEQPEFRRK